MTATPTPTQTLAQRLEAAALAEGFVAAGGVDLEDALSSRTFQAHLARYDEWLQAGNASNMGYLIRGRDRRADPRRLFPATRSVFCVLAPYSTRLPGVASAEAGPRFARYLNGKDYHDEVAQKLESVLRQVSTPLQNTGGPPLEWKVCVDTSAVLERSWAALAGLGWIGKNTLLIHPKHGSFTFIGVALLNQALGQPLRAHPDFCGHCSRCLQGCPTQAFSREDGTPAERWLDARKCIASWTLETRGVLPLSETQKRAIGARIAGCDICQEVCPFNRKALLHRNTPAIEPQGPLTDLEWAQLLCETGADFKLRVRDSALNRIKPAEWSRNLAITFRNAALELPPAERRVFCSAHLKRVEERAHCESSDFARTEWLETLAMMQEALGPSDEL